MKIVFLSLLFTLTVQFVLGQREQFPPNLLINSTVRIEGEYDSIVNGTKFRYTSVGTGFFFMFKVDTTEVKCLVTAKHVIARTTFGKIQFHIATSAKFPQIFESQTFEFKNFNARWIFLPNNDLAILPLKKINDTIRQRIGAEIYGVSFSGLTIPTIADSLKISSIEKVLMIGYPKGIWDSVSNLPIVRQGLTATPYFANFNGQKNFLVDIPVFPGSSGSPIVLYSFDPYWKDMQWLMNDFRSYFLGIIVQSYSYSAEGDLIITKGDQNIKDSLGLSQKYKSSTQIPFNLGVVIKAEELVNFIPLLRQHIKSDGKDDPKK